MYDKNRPEHPKHPGIQRKHYLEKRAKIAIFFAFSREIGFVSGFFYFKIKIYIFRKFQEKVYSDAAKKIEYEMKNLHENLEKYEFRLRNLREYFELPEETKKELPKTVKYPKFLNFVFKI